MLGLMQDWPLRLHCLLDYAAVQFGTQEIASRKRDGGTTRTTYAALRSRARRVARRLQIAGIAPGERVATLAWNSAAHLETWFGIAGAGAIYHTVNPRLYPEQVAYILDHGGARIAFVDPAALPLLEGLRGTLRSLKSVIVFDDGPAETREGDIIGYEEWLAGADREADWVDGGEREASGLCYTSGTTGTPKGVLYTHRSTLLHTLSLASSNGFAIGLRDTVMPIVPMFHVNAWGLPFASALTGARLAMPGLGLDGASLASLMEEQGVTVAAGVPTVWMGLVDHLRRSGRRLSTLRRAVIGGSACSRALIDGLETEFGIEVCHAWGMTETSPVGTVCGAKSPAQDASTDQRLALKETQGFGLFGVEMKIVDDGGNAQPWDGATPGRFMVRGWTVARAYFGEDTPILDDDGYFDTGDIATINPDGYVRIVDRTKDVIKSGGEWISSIAIENLVAAHPNVAEAAVIGVPDPTWGERPLLLVVGRDGAEPTKVELLALLEGRIAKWWMPDDVRVVDSLPHTATGKISKKDLRAMVAKAEADKPASLETPSLETPSLRPGR